MCCKSQSIEANGINIDLFQTACKSMHVTHDIIQTKTKMENAKQNNKTK